MLGWSGRGVSLAAVALLLVPVTGCEFEKTVVDQSSPGGGMLVDLGEDVPAPLPEGPPAAPEVPDETCTDNCDAPAAEADAGPAVADAGPMGEAMVDAGAPGSSDVPEPTPPVPGDAGLPDAGAGD